MPPENARRNVLTELKHQPETHPGLWLDRFLQYQTGDPRNGIQDADAVNRARTELLDEVVASHVPSLYRNAFLERLRGFIQASVSGRCVKLWELRCNGRVVVGLGQKGVVEAGITLERTWGVPILPGSALKGLASAAAHRLASDDSWRRPKTTESPAGESARILFGDTNDAGAVTFHDAWWFPEASEQQGPLKTPLVADVMTVHHPGYYQERADRVGDATHRPDGTDSPIPVGFLSAHGTWLLALEGPDEAWVDAACELLKLGLEHLGIGAKTSSGYGRFEVVGEGPVVRGIRDGITRTELARTLDAAGLLENAVSLLLSTRTAGKPLLDELRKAPPVTAADIVHLLGRQKRTADMVAQWIALNDPGELSVDAFKRALARNPTVQEWATGVDSLSLANSQKQLADVVTWIGVLAVAEPAHSNPLSDIPGADLLGPDDQHWLAAQLGSDGSLTPATAEMLFEQADKAGRSQELIDLLFSIATSAE